MPTNNLNMNNSSQASQPIDHRWRIAVSQPPRDARPLGNDARPSPSGNTR